MARERGCYARKITSIGYRGLPDLIVIRDRIVLLWEVKSRQGTVTKIQQIEHQHINGAGGNIVVTYGLPEALSILEAWFP
jgi:Holliday junction resolvase